MILVVIILAACIVVVPDRYVSAAEMERRLMPSGGLPTPRSVPSPSKPPPGLGINIATIPWTESNIATLRAADKADVVRFLNRFRGYGTENLMPSENVTEFSWVDLEGNGNYALVMVQSSGVCCNSMLLICRRNEAGKITMQVLPVTGPLSRVIRDVNGDGQKELIIPPPVDPAFAGYAVVPHVYRLGNGKYAEASKDFASYYDTGILPPIEKAISQTRFRLAHGPIEGKPTERWQRFMRHKLAELTMDRDKILRMIGRDPDAGLKKAREWMNSPDTVLVQDAITVFKNIGGHETDVLTATDRLKEERCDVNGFGPSALRGDKAQSDWLAYTNAKDGLSFRYPPSMRVEERDPATFHFDYPPQVIVDVVGPGAILRFICARGVKTPEMAAATLRRYRQQSSQEERPCASMKIDGHEAFVGGPLNGPWSVDILQPRACEIFPMAGGWDDAPPPHDGKSPLLSIIRTVHFESVPSQH